MFLAIRMVLYLVFGIIAGQGLEFFHFDQATGNVRIAFNVKDVAAMLAGMAGFGGVFGLSFLDKLRGPAKGK